MGLTVDSETFDRKNVRHHVAVDPQTDDSDVINIAKDDVEFSAYWQQMKALDEAIKNTSEIPVPTDLEATLLAIAANDIADSEKQSGGDVNDEPAQSKVVPFSGAKRNNLIQLAMVASIAFAIGLSFTFFNQQPNLQSGTDIAMAHVYHEQEYTNNRDRIVHLDDVNAKLASFGGAMAATPAKVTFANFCFFENQKSLHLVMDTDQGQVTMFITPGDVDAHIDSQFGDDKYQGRSWKMQQVDITVIGEKNQISKEKMEYLKNSMQFSA